MSKKVKDDLAKKARKALRERELGARHYEKSDFLLEELSKEVEPGQPIPLGDGKEAVLVDQFAGKTIVWNPCAARRYKLETRAARSAAA